MGSRFSYSTNPNACNYYCPVCKISGKEPNLAGRFFLISETQCQCNGCNNIFDKSIIYRPVINDAVSLAKGRRSEE